MMVGAEQSGIEGMVLWDPVINGRAYIEELKALHQEQQWRYIAKNHNHPKGEGLIEILGFPLTDFMLADLKRIDLLAIQHKPANHPKSTA